MHVTDRSASDPPRGLLRLYPRAWRDRYEGELRAVLESRPLTRRARSDLLLGALDAHVHPLTPPTAPVVSALLAGVLLTVTGLASSLQPLMPDWPGFLLETLPVAALGAIAALVAVLQTGRRSGLDAPRGTTLAIAIAVRGHALWIVALAIGALGAHTARSPPRPAPARRSGPSSSVSSVHAPATIRLRKRCLWSVARC